MGYGGQYKYGISKQIQTTWKWHKQKKARNIPRDLLGGLA